MKERDKVRPSEYDELPEHERRPEDNTGGGLTSSGISAEQRGPVNEEVLQARGEEEPDIERQNEDEQPPAHRAHPG